MCLEDIRIMGQSSGVQLTRAIAATSSLLLGPSPSRIGIVFCSHNTEHYWVSPNTDAVVGQGIRITANSAPLILDVFHHGDLCRRPWNAIAEANPVTVSALELSLATELSREAKYG